MDSDEVEFLRDQVHRLNAELAKYRRRLPRLPDEEGPIPTDGPPPPWLTDRSIMSPLMAEYDQQIKEVQMEVGKHKERTSQLEAQIDHVIKDNDRLTNQLKESVKSQLENVQVDDLEPLTGDEEVMQNLQQQTESALQEKDAALSRWQEAEQEMDRLRKQLQEEKDSHQWRVVEQQAQQMQAEYYETVTVLHKEIEELQESLRKTKHDLETVTNQNKDLLRANTELDQQIQWKDQELNDVLFKEGVTDSKMGHAKQIMDETKHRLSTATKELEEIKRDKGGLEARVTELQKRNNELEQREFDAVVQVRDAVQMVENSVMEKDQAEVSVKQKEEELEQLQEVINKLINEAGMRTRQEVDNVRTQCNERITKLTDEVHALEMDNTEKQTQLERALRDKRAAESELDKLHKEMMDQNSKEKLAYEELNRRCITAERLKDESSMKIETLQSSLQREDMNTQQLKSQTETHVTQTKDRMSSMEQEIENLNEDRVRLLEEMDDMKKRVQAAEREKEAANRKYQKEMTIMEQDVQMKFRDYEVKLQSTEDVNRHSMGELRKLLTAQQRMSARWKEECQVISQKFEAKIQDLRSEVSQLKRRNDELTNLLRDSQEKTVEAERMITDYARNIRRIEERMRESESRAADASHQLSRHKLREKQMQSERRSLLQEIQQNSQLEASTRSVRISDALRVGDLTSSQRSQSHQMNGSVKKTGFDVDDVVSDR